MVAGEYQPSSRSASSLSARSAEPPLPRAVVAAVAHTESQVSMESTMISLGEVSGDSLEFKHVGTPPPPPPPRREPPPPPPGTRNNARLSSFL